MELISAAVIPLVVVLVGGVIFFGRKDYFSVFCHGAARGLESAVKLLPSLTAVMVALKMFTASGAVEILTSAAGGVGELLGIPSQMLPLLITRPISGAASNGAFVSLMEETGADSLPSLCAAVLMGSSDTIVYVMAVYFSSTGIKRTAHAFPTAVAVMLFAVFFSCFLGRLFFPTAA